MREPILPADSHVHSEFSWDAANGSMERTCAEAVRRGLPAVAFTEHADHTPWLVHGYDAHLSRISVDGLLTPPPMDLDGYLASIERCRDLFPQLRILSGLELGEPHWHPEAVAKLTAAPLDRLLGSLHCLPLGDGFSEPPGQFAARPAAEVLHDYLAEIPKLIEGSSVFAVLAHIDYPVRYWPGEFDPAPFEDGYRHALRTLAGTGRALELNTRLPFFHATLLRWWWEEGGEAVSFGSDAHMPHAVGDGLADAAARAQAQGFRPGRHPYDFWLR
ncbi:PHP domain-containing protein [Hamadaea tsunoensis]|uniref:PHP domain-containing protein n=1 Tax=Hamadaea tsunoensis TaxID=53368 RepID=UPI00042425B7|nr:PHP domain-containing protein [Hamadaea tsunoensis]